MSDQNQHAWADLSHHNTLAVPARARRLVVAATLAELAAAIKDARKSKQRFLVLGEGSNTVFTDDFDGTIILNRLKGIQVIEESERGVTVCAAAGEGWHDFVTFTVEQNWFGIENLALIPGLVGAAPIQNIGAYGCEVKDTIVQVEVYDIQQDQCQSLPAEACEFDYRDSRFKRDWLDQKIITAVHFHLEKYGQVNTTYPALAQRVGDRASLQQVFQTVVEIRSEKLPKPELIPNAGSFFKNPIVDKATLAKLQSEFPDIAFFAHRDAVKLAAAWLIDHAGWKGRVIDGISVHQQQALVVINPNRRHGRVIRNFAQAVQQDIRAKFGVQLEIEPRLI